MTTDRVALHRHLRHSRSDDHDVPTQEQLEGRRDPMPELTDEQRRRGGHTSGVKQWTKLSKDERRERMRPVWEASAKAAAEKRKQQKS